MAIFGSCQEKTYLCAIELKKSLERYAEIDRQGRRSIRADVAVG